MATIAIVGSGVVGRATGEGFLRRGHRVVFYDIDPEKAADLARDGRTVSPSLAFEGERPAFVFLAVPTPTRKGKVDLSAVEEASRGLGSMFLGRSAVKGAFPVIAVKSTVPPGTTEGLVRPLLERCSRKKAGSDFGIASNPEYLRERSALEDFVRPRLVLVGAADRRTGRRLRRLYAPFGAPVALVKTEEAELQKYIHNLFNAAKISFFNEMRGVAERLGCDADKLFRLTIESAEAFWNPLYGLEDRGPYGGACLPKDTQAFLAWAGNHLATPLPLLKSVIRANENAKRKVKSEKEEAKVKSVAYRRK
jgi:UDPglucose 6-dehydrogenase